MGEGAADEPPFFDLLADSTLTFSVLIATIDRYRCKHITTFIC